MLRPWHRDGIHTRCAPRRSARLLSQFVGDMCVVALASEDRRALGPFAVESRDLRMTAMRRRSTSGPSARRGRSPATRCRGAGRIDRIRPGELEGIVNPAMDATSAASGEREAFVPMRGAAARRHRRHGPRPGRPAYTPRRSTPSSVIADGAGSEGDPGGACWCWTSPHDRARGAARRRAALPHARRAVPAIVFEAEPGADGRWLYVSGFVETLLGYTPEEWLRRPGAVGRAPASTRTARWCSRPRSAWPPASASRWSTGCTRATAASCGSTTRRPPRDDAGARLLEGLLTDITDRKAAETRLQHLADHDALTGLLNRRRFVEELELEIAAVRRGMRSSAAMVIDIDGFKYVNDTFGHQAGDELIRAVAARCASACAPATRSRAWAATSSRACCAAPSAEGAEAVAAELLGDAARQPFALGEETVRGDRQRGHRGARRGRRATAEGVLSAADIAMYEGKHGGPRPRRALHARPARRSSSAAARGSPGSARRSRRTASSCSRQPVARPADRRGRAARAAAAPARRGRRARRPDAFLPRRRALRPRRGDRPLGAAPRARAPARRRDDGRSCSRSTCPRRSIGGGQRDPAARAGAGASAASTRHD